MFDILEKELLFNDFWGDIEYEPNDVSSMKGAEHSPNNDNDSEDDEQVEQSEEESDNELEVDLCDMYSLISESNAKQPGKFDVNNNVKGTQC